MSRARKKQNSDSKDGFLFLANDLVLDFLNTRPVHDGELTELIPDFRALLRWFQTAGLLRSGQASVLQQRWGGSDRARRIIEAVRQLREKLRKEISSWRRTGALHRSTANQLNRLMADHPMRTRLEASASGPSMELYFEPRQPEDLLTPLAHSAATLFAHVDRSRVRKCDQCVLYFHDTSKKGTRRWCSMQLCGNRRKVAAYAARQRRRRLRMTKRP